MESIAVQPCRQYRLEMCDGTSWWLLANEENAPWVDHLAAIMRLEVCDEDKALTPCMGSLWVTRESVAFAERLIAGIDCSNPDRIAKYAGMWRSLRPIYWHAILKGGLPFHAALAELNGRGFLMAAPGGTGKSTCSRRLPSPWKSLCDDEAIIVMSGGQFRAHPFPTWSDYIMARAEKTWDVQSSVPLCAVFFLEHADHDEVVPLGKGQASVRINDAITQVCESARKTMDQDSQRQFRKLRWENSCRVANAVPAFILRESLTGSFWEKIEQVLA